MWLENMRSNEERYGFNETFKASKSEGKKSLVIAAGPSFKRFMHENMENIASRRNDITIVACDGALPALSQYNCIPDYVLTVDGFQIVADFYKKSRNILKNTTAILSTTAHPDVVEECTKSKLAIKWIQP